MRSHRAALKLIEVDRMATSPWIQPPYKTLRKAVNAQKLRCIDRLVWWFVQKFAPISLG